MSAPKLGNCPRCGKLYLRFREICDHCYQKEEDDYIKAADYLRENPGITIYDLSEATKVSIPQIRQFIWSGRIIAGQFPSLQYPCEICGSLIRAGKRCSSCTETASQLSSNVEKEDRENSSRNTSIAGGYISKYL